MELRRVHVGAVCRNQPSEDAMTFDFIDAMPSEWITR
jgi:hypothetical protein